jgi:translation initiation factor 2B subunit (eIF-2B alpha/beta/delta family)
MINPEISRLIEEIRTDTTRGASQLARQAAEVFRQAAENTTANSAYQMLEELTEVGLELQTVRPAMAPLYNLAYGITRVLEEKLPGKFPEEARRLAVGLADGAVQQSYLAVARVADYSAGLLKDGDVALTHSYSSTVIAALRRGTQSKAISALVTRSGAGRTGGALAAELVRYGVLVTLIDDTAVGIYAERANVVFFGADRITRDAVLVNGVGTYPLALAAERAGVPCYALCESLKFDPRIEAAAVDLEDRDGAEIDAGEIIPGISLANPHFDLTPLGLLRGVVTEGGVMTPHEVRAKLVAKR